MLSRSRTRPTGAAAFIPCTSACRHRAPPADCTSTLRARGTGMGVGFDGDVVNALTQDLEYALCLNAAHLVCGFGTMRGRGRGREVGGGEDGVVPVCLARSLVSPARTRPAQLADAMDFTRAEANPENVLIAGRPYTRVLASALLEVQGLGFGVWSPCPVRHAMLVQSEQTPLGIPAVTYRPDRRAPARARKQVRASDALPALPALDGLAEVDESKMAKCWLEATVQAVDEWREHRRRSGRGLLPERTGVVLAEGTAVFVST